MAQRRENHRGDASVAVHGWGAEEMQQSPLKEMEEATAGFAAEGWV